MIAPKAPGKLGVPVQPQEMLTYLADLGSWITERRAELDALDADIMRTGASLTSDMALSLSLWQAVQEQYNRLVTVWDSGRVGPVEQEKLSTLIWGRLDRQSYSLPEACQLSDALVGQMRAQLRLNPAATQLTMRLQNLRAQLERLRDQATLEPGESRAHVEATIAQLAARVETLHDKHGRGGDIGGLIGPLENEAAGLERNLIVGGVERRKSLGQFHQAKVLLNTVKAEEKRVNDLVAECIVLLEPIPKQAVPDVDALGPIPANPAELNAYVAKLNQVQQAYGLISAKCAEAKAAHEAYRRDLETFANKLPAEAPAEARQLIDTTRNILALRPTPMPVAFAAMNAVHAYVVWLTEEH